MKVLLIDPKFPQSSFSFPRGIEPFGLLCVATYLHHKGKDVELLDMNAEDLDYDDLPRVIREKKPQIVGVPSSMTCYIPNSYRVCEIAKSVDPNIITVGGGINFTVVPEFYMSKCPSLDFVIRGDSEPTMLEFVEAMENGRNDFHNMKGLTFRDGDKINVNSIRLVEDMDSLPFPNWSLVDLDKYHTNLFPPQWGRQAVLTISRGCPYNCNYCVATRGQGSKYRYPSTEWAVESLSLVRHKYGRRMLWVNDLCFGVNDEWTEDFFTKVVERKLDINMCIDMRTDQIIRQKRLLPLMRKAGVRIIATGVESPLEKDEEKYAKKTGGNSPAGMAEEAVKLVKKAGIERWNFYMIGSPYHSPKDIRSIYKFANKLDAEVTIFAFVTPLPGTPFYDEVKDLITTDDISHYGEREPVTKNFYMSPKELLVLDSELWVGYYAKPGRVLRRLLFNRGFGGWFYKKIYGRAKAYGGTIRGAKVMGHWPVTEEEERELKKWAKKTLGASLMERKAQDFMFKFFKLLRREGPQAH